jgi:hypothetical protein
MHFSIARCAGNSNKNNNKSAASASSSSSEDLWTLVNQKEFTHALMSAQVCALSKVYQMANPLSDCLQLQQQQQGGSVNKEKSGARRRQRLQLPTCNPSAFELFIPAGRWWGPILKNSTVSSVIHDAITCLRRGIPSSQLNSEAYVSLAELERQSKQQKKKDAELKAKKKKSGRIPVLPIVQPPLSNASGQQQQQNHSTNTRPTTSNTHATSDNNEHDNSDLIGGSQNASFLMNQLDEIVEEDGSNGEGGDGEFFSGEDINSSFFGDTVHSFATLDSFRQNNKPGSSNSNRRQSNNTVAHDEHQNDAEDAEHHQQAGTLTPKPPQTPPARGVALLNLTHIQQIISFRVSRELDDDFIRLITTSRQNNIISESNATTNSQPDSGEGEASTPAAAQSSASLPLELFFTTLVLGTQTRRGHIIKMCTISDAAAVSKKIARDLPSLALVVAQQQNSHSTHHHLEPKSPLGSSGNIVSMANDAFSLTSTKQSQLFEAVRSLKVNSVRDFASLPCFVQKSSISKSTGPGAEMCTLWEILSSFFSYLPFTRLIPLIASDEAYLSRCERRFVVANSLVFSNNSGTLSALQSPKGAGAWINTHTDTMMQLDQEGIPVDGAVINSARVPIVDVATIQVAPESFEAAFLDEPIDPVVMQLVVREHKKMTYHGDICSLWGQEAWTRVNPRCLPTRVW